MKILRSLAVLSLCNLPFLSKALDDEYPENRNLRAMAAKARRVANDIVFMNDDMFAQEVIAENENFFLRAEKDKARKNNKENQRRKLNSNLKHNHKPKNFRKKR